MNAREYSASISFHFSATRSEITAWLEAILNGLQDVDIFWHLTTAEINIELTEAHRLYNELLAENVAVANGNANRLAMFEQTAQYYLARIVGIEEGMAITRTENAATQSLASGDPMPIEIITTASEEAQVQMQATNIPDVAASDIPIGPSSNEGAVGGKMQSDTAQIVDKLNKEFGSIALRTDASRVPIFPTTEYTLPPGLDSRISRYMKERAAASTVRRLNKKRAGQIMFNEESEWILMDVYDDVADSSWRLHGEVDSMPSVPADDPIGRLSITISETAQIEGEPKAEQASAETTANTVNIAYADNIAVHIDKSATASAAVVGPARGPEEAPSSTAQQSGTSPVSWNSGQEPTTSSIQRHPPCQHCGEHGHNIIRCKYFLELTVDQRIARVMELNLCGNCFRRHLEICHRPKCPRCKAPHNSLLCKINPK